MSDGRAGEGQIILKGVLDPNDLSAFAVHEMSRFMSENNGKCIAFILDDLLAYVTAMKDAVATEQLDVMTASFEMNVAPTVGRAMFLISVASAFLTEREKSGLQPKPSTTKH
ncbi:hypothetical protein [Acetobacter cibinongensis]|uniref:Uncharacterized protein n=1 Tax=Acetobacter cibinongensis TaxID=146475 RepID=A0A1Z5YTC0_9PROT|nr:hypothetical protein [Acetobacter cibinongensis]OUJ01546.1 hypothetical protein HK14_08915 [Acetobacter cibinongensis]